MEQLVMHVKRHIADDYRASDDPDDNTPGIYLTVGANENGDWDYQTGDNSFTGGAYGYPHWAVVSVYRKSNSRELAREIQDQLADLMSQ